MLTLAKSVINTMDVFQKQVQKMPSRVLKELDRAVRHCVWGDTTEHRKIHLINWEILCRPKERGGFGLKRAEGMNKALLAKLGWRLLTQGEDLWAKMIRKKYGVSLDGPVTFKSRQRASLTWRGLQWVEELRRKDLRWRLGDGRRIHFWSDVWINDQPLLQSEERASHV